MCVEINLGGWLDMNINDNLSINSPVDNKNVVVVRARKTDTVLRLLRLLPIFGWRQRDIMANL
ncbi:clostridial neurotoxin zinc protease family protein (plasmid) [Clostridium botulinum]|nr:clostridial neurotoxin zinc protease family protein [Clostridium botulinum]